MFADEAGRHGVEQPVMEATVSEAEVAWILVKDDGKKGVSDHGAIKGVEIRCSGTFKVSLGAPTEPWTASIGFSHTGDDEGNGEGIGVDCGAKGKADLLFWSQGDGVTHV